jgi:hypothetical protein
MGPAPRVHVYEHGHQPLMYIRVDGEWRFATVRARHTWPDERVAYQVDLQLTGPGGIVGSYSRTYWWSESAMRPIRR